MQHPNARSTDLLVSQLDEETLLYDLKTNKAYCLNKTAADVYALCDGTRSVSALERATGYSNEVVDLALSQFEKDNLIDAASMPLREPTNISRRQAFRNLAFASAVALPVVLSMVAPPTAHAATCAAPGNGCVSPAVCCSGLCSANQCV